MEINDFCTECTKHICTNIDICRTCADYQNKRYKEANSFAEKTVFINLILVWTCLTLVATIVGLII